ncbi:alkaline phosphatase family protein [Curtobacterium sp. ISL-83]|uniref:alkaline phosphatase family protein n=1 Tax=Curtobacterium sp. ISL-83 TaxID=2819145 RepID=UPI001BE90EB4|nr:alkaline phosphatase family protein [Curtobacterium sp. ISL-83]MBT2503648.1 alkaline phosphatase family protein [Curtobacterium sp. ISL-83]
MKRPIIIAGAALSAAALCGAFLVTPASATPSRGGDRGTAKHVIVISVDGMHRSDLSAFVRSHPHSTMAQLAGHGTQYTNAQTTFPSDSFPGLVAQFTGATPAASGVWYDDTYNRDLLAPGTRDCTTATPGTEVALTEAIDRSQSPIQLDAGQGLTDPALTALATNTKAQTLASADAITKAILKMTPTPQTLINQDALPVDPATCLPIQPGQYLKTNTVFEVARSHGLRTAWSDKHPAYAILDGKSGTGVQDLFTPEINSVADNAGDDWSTDNALTQVYDATKVAAVLNEIDGYDHSRTHHVGTPAVFGMNFQTLSTAQKLPTSDGLSGGYQSNGTPGPLVSRALDSVDAQLGAIVHEVVADGLAGNTTIILSAKHGQSPIDPATLRRVDDSAIIGSINDAWKKTHPQAPALVTFSTDDDGMLLWLSDRSAAAESFARSWLLGHTAPANTAQDPKGVFSTTVGHSGLSAVYTGGAAKAYVGAAGSDDRVPDLIGVAQSGVVFTGGVKKIAEHGGASVADRNVPLVVASLRDRHAQVVKTTVQTTQIAPTILHELGINPSELRAVREQHVSTLPVR